jgi:hypothetical protein
MKKILLIGIVAGLLVFAGIAGAAMMGPGAGTIGAGAMMGGGFAMTNTGGFGMTNGMAGAPVVGDDGTAYVVSYNPSANPGTVPTSSSFESTITAVSPSGAVSSITLNGMVSRPVVYGNALVATASLPDFSNFDVLENLGSTTPSGQSMVYVVNLPITSSSVPVGASLDGRFASTPVIEHNNAYVVTSDFGNGMMTGNSTFGTMYGNYNFNSTGTAHSYLYIIGLDGSLVNKIPLQ